jgi:succinate dehydrogenase flavin-adding protein (antitoxin of CptAB toxin-antitoxin module)
MKELDLLLTRWLDREFDHASPRQRALFERLLALPDPELASYLVAGEAPQPGEGGAETDAAEFAALIQSIRTGNPIMSSTPAPGREP